MTSFCVQFEKVGHRLLLEAFRGKGEWAFGWKREGEKRKDQSWKTLVNIGVLAVHKTNTGNYSCVVIYKVLDVIKFISFVIRSSIVKYNSMYLSSVNIYICVYDTWRST